MSIQTKNWNIEFDKTPDAEGLRVSGIVSVPYDARLEAVPDQASSALRLNIILPVEYNSTAAPLVDKPVSYFEPGPMKYNDVLIFHGEELILKSTDLLMLC